MRTGHVIGIDFKLRFCQKLAVIIQQQGLADLISIGFLRPGLHQNFALEHSDRAIGAKADYYSARLALFWALLASTPAVVLAGMTKGFIGPGPAHTAVGALWLVIFLWILINSLIEAEQ